MSFAYAYSMIRDTMESLLALQNWQSKTRVSAAEKEAAIRELRGKIPTQILAHFDRFQIRDKKGVAIVRNGVCSECHMRVAIGVLATLMHGDDIQLCGSCGRYLYLPEDARLAMIQPPAEIQPVKEKRKKRETAHAH